MLEININAYIREYKELRKLVKYALVQNINNENWEVAETFKEQLRSIDYSVEDLNNYNNLPERIKDRLNVANKRFEELNTLKGEKNV